MYQRILVPVDGSATSNRGLVEAIALGRLGGGQLRLINVVDAFSLAMGIDAVVRDPDESEALIPLMRNGGQKILATARVQVEAAGVPVETVLREGWLRHVSDAIVDESRAWSADLIVIGSHGRRGVERLIMGSDAERVLRLARVSVLVVRADTSAIA